MRAVHEVKALVISFSPRLIYNIYNTQRIKIPLGFGVTGHFANYSKNTYTESDSGDDKVIMQKEDYFK